MRFVLLMKQRGEGCGYMIGCGYRYVFFDAEDMDDALYKARMPRQDGGDAPPSSINY
jgi:hypothetical protein